MKLLAPVVLASVCIVAAGCASNSKRAATSSGKPVNKVCPMMLEHEVPQKNPATAQYKGQTVGFCCADCTGEWEKLSEAKRDKMLADAIAAK